MIKINGVLINPRHVVFAEVQTWHNTNGSDSSLFIKSLFIKFANGTTLRKQHGFGFDAFAALKEIEKEVDNSAHT